MFICTIHSIIITFFLSRRSIKSLRLTTLPCFSHVGAYRRLVDAPPKSEKRGFKRVDANDDAPQKKTRSNQEKNAQTKILLPRESSARVARALKAAYGALASAFPTAAAYLHPEVTQPQEPQRGDLPPPAVGNLRLGANQQLLSDRQAEVAAIIARRRAAARELTTLCLNKLAWHDILSGLGKSVESTTPIT